MDNWNLAKMLFCKVFLGQNRRLDKQDALYNHLVAEQADFIVPIIAL